MTFQHVDVIHVTYCHDHPIPMGRIALKNRQVFFEYTPSFLELGLELSPFKLPLQSGVIACGDRVFDGMFGIFNDSLPDGWGRFLVDRKLRKIGVNPDALTPLDRLRYVGSRGMGALMYEPEIAGAIVPVAVDLDSIADECIEFQEHDDDQFVEDLLALNGSSAGARPKILISLINNHKLEITDNSLSHKHNDWIVKFRSTYDPKDIGSIEYAYHLMALDAGLDVPEAKLFKSKKCSGYFGVKRFDRFENKFFHMHTMSGLLHADHRIPSLDYETVMKVTLWLTKNAHECETQFRNAVFNVLAHNRDDHAKNFSFLMDGNGSWTVSPAYDLTFSSGPGGEHCTMIMGEGKNPKREHLLKLAATTSIKPQRALEIIDQVAVAVSKWRLFAEAAQVSRASSNAIQAALQADV